MLLYRKTIGEYCYSTEIMHYVSLSRRAITSITYGAHALIATSSGDGAADYEPYFRDISA